MTSYAAKRVAFLIWKRIGEAPRPVQALWQQHCLRSLLQTAFQVMAYRRLWRGADFSPHAFRLKDLEKLPVITKHFFRNRRYYEYISPDKISRYQDYTIRRICDASGQPLVFLQDNDYDPCRARLSDNAAVYMLPEFGPVAWQCPHCRGRQAYHVFDESLILEVVDENGARVQDGARGRIVVTYFNNHAMPFVRYDTGEQGSYFPRACACGKRLFMPVVKKLPRVVLGNRIFYLSDFYGVFGNYCGFVDRFGIGTDGRALRVTVEAGRLWSEALRPELAAEIRKAAGDAGTKIKLVVRRGPALTER